MTPNYGLLFRWSCRGVKYFAFLLVGLGLGYTLSHVFGFAQLFLRLAIALWPFICRLGILLVSSMLLAVITESVKN